MPFTLELGAALTVLLLVGSACNVGDPPRAIDRLWGGTHLCAGSEGKLYCAGKANFAGVGDTQGGASGVPFGGGTPVGYPRLTEVTGLDHVVQVAESANHSCVRTESGQVSCWGDGSFGQLGATAGETRLARVPLAGPAIDIAVGHTSSCAVVEGGDLYCWGDHRVGQLGLESWECGGETGPDGTPVCIVATPTRVALDGVTDVALGFTHGCAIAERGVYCWGAPTAQAPRAPVPRLLASVPQAQFITATFDYTCIVTPEAAAHCWTASSEGAPTVVAEQTRALHLTAGMNLIQQTDGTVRMFDRAGRLSAPVEALAGGEDLVSADFNPEHSQGRSVCVRFDGGRVRCVVYGREQFGRPFEPGWAR